MVEHCCVSPLMNVGWMAGSGTVVYGFLSYLAQSSITSPLAKIARTRRSHLVSTGVETLKLCMHMVSFVVQGSDMNSVLM